MHFSTTFERKLRLDTGLHFLWIRSRPAFLSRRSDNGCLPPLLNTSCVWDILNICMTVLKYFGSNCFNKSVGIGSSLQVLVVMLNISFLTSSLVRGANLLNKGAFDGLGVYCSVSSKSSLTVSLLLRK